MITSLRKSPHSNYYAFEHKKGSIELILEILNKLNIDTYPTNYSWYTQDRDGEPTNKLQPLKWFIDKHFYIESAVDENIFIDIIFSEKLIHLLIFTKKDLQKQISDAVMKYSRIKTK